MKPSVRAVVVAAVTVTSALCSNLAFASTFSKNIPGALRHPIHEGAKAISADDDSHRGTRHYTYHTHHHVYHSTRVHHRRHRHRR